MRRHAAKCALGHRSTYSSKLQSYLPVPKYSTTEQRLAPGAQCNETRPLRPSVVTRLDCVQVCFAHMQVGKRQGVQVVDLWAAFQAQWSERLFKDGIHPSHAGNRLIWQQLKPAMEQSLQSIYS